MTRFSIGLILILAGLLAHASTEQKGISALLPFTHDIAITYGIDRLIVKELPKDQSEIRIWIGFGSSYVDSALILRSKSG